MLSRPTYPQQQLTRSDADGDGRRMAAELMPLVYEELRGLAAARLRQERSGHTLQPTALVHEAFLRLAKQTQAEFRDRGHFFAVAAEALRRVLVDHARIRQADKRQAAGRRLTISAAIDAPDDREIDLITLDEALSRLAQLSARQARVVELRFFAGLDIDETATALGVSEGTVKGDWRLARAWLERELAGGAA